MPSDFVFDDAAFMAFVNRPTGPIARELNNQADEIVQETKVHLSVPAPVPIRINDTGIPWMRTGDLMRSVRRIQTFDIQTRTVQVEITAPSIHHGEQYQTTLIEKGFDLVPPRVRLAQQ